MSRSLLGIRKFREALSALSIREGDCFNATLVILATGTPSGVTLNGEYCVVQAHEPVIHANNMEPPLCWGLMEFDLPRSIRVDQGRRAFISLNVTIRAMAGFLNLKVHEARNIPLTSMQPPLAGSPEAQALLKRAMEIAQALRAVA